MRRCLELLACVVCLRHRWLLDARTALLLAAAGCLVVMTQLADWYPQADVNDFKFERLDDLVATFDEFDVLLLQESWVVLSQGRKNKLVSAAKEKGDLLTYICPFVLLSMCSLFVFVCLFVCFSPKKWTVLSLN